MVTKPLVFNAELKLEATELKSKQQEHLAKKTFVEHNDHKYRISKLLDDISKPKKQRQRTCEKNLTDTKEMNNTAAN